VANIVGLTVPPSAAPIPPPGATVQPAPPSGARREAKQRQAATAKSEEGAQSGSEQGGIETASSPLGPPESAMTRRDRAKPAADGFTPLRAHAQPSAWTTTLEWGGGTALMALVLAFGWITVRPTPRGRRRDEVRPAPVYLRNRRP
jgi:hypothetical protein